MKKITAIAGIGLLLVVLAGTTVVLARGSSCHGSEARSTMMRGASGHHGGMMMGWMHRMHGTVSGWWNEAPVSDDAGSVERERDREPEPGAVDSETVITVRTKFADGLAYEGASGDLEGTVNPTLRVKRGEAVTIRLINAMGGSHDLAVPALDVGSGVLTQRGATTSFRFVPERTGEFAYYCTVPGHRSAGMKGTIVVE